MSKFLQDKRKTRGLRMADLIGKAADEDYAFWNNEVWGEQESDEEFSEEEVKPDVFDSDFNDSEDDNEEEDSDDEGGDRKRDRETANKSSSNRYKEPHQIKRVTHKKVVKLATDQNDDVDDDDDDDDDDDTKTKPTKDTTAEAASKTKKKIKLESSSSSFSTASLESSGPRQIRDSTKNKSIAFENRIKKSSSSSSLSGSGHGHGHNKERESKEGTFHQFTQKELLLDALETEKLNKTWLESQKFTNEQSNSSSSSSSEEALKHLMNRGSGDDDESGMIRTLSRRGTYNTITFTEDSLIPTCLQRKKQLPKVPEKVCVITGLAAKYKDPHTQFPYANLLAYKELRRRYPIESNNNSSSATNIKKMMSIQSRQKM